MPSDLDVSTQHYDTMALKPEIDQCRGTGCKGGETNVSHLLHRIFFPDDCNNEASLHEHQQQFAVQIGDIYRGGIGCITRYAKRSSDELKESPSVEAHPTYYSLQWHH